MRSARLRLGWLVTFTAALVGTGFAWQDSQTGVVVEKVAKNSSADRAGLRESDTVLSWRRNEDQGRINSPFDLSAVEIEQASRSAVTLSGLRGQEALTWTLNPTDNWGLETRPQLSKDLLGLYEQGQRAANEGRIAEAAELWQTAGAGEHLAPQSWLTVWFISRSAKFLADAQQWTLADQAYQTALEQAARVDTEIEAQLSRRWAETFQRRADMNRSAQLYRQALAKNRQGAAQSMAAAANLTSLGYIARTLGNWDEAEIDYTQALTIRETLAPDSLAVAWALGNLSVVTDLRGALTQEYTQLQRALAIKERVAPGTLDMARTLEKLGTLARERGDLRKAEEYYQEARTILEKLEPDGPNLARILNGSGSVPWEQGDLPRAEDYFLKALSIMEKAAPQNEDIPTFLNNLGAVALDEENLDKAEKYFKRTLTLSPQGSPRAATVLTNLGNVAGRRGDLAGAEQYYTRSQEIEEKLAPDSLAAADNFYRLGEIAWRLKDPAGAEKYHRRALEIRQHLAPGAMSHAESLAALGAIMRAAGRLEESAGFFDQALHALDNQVSRLGGNEEVRSSFRARHSDFYRDYIDVLIHRRDPEAAFQVLERSRARTLLELLTEAHINIRQGVDPALLEQERSLEAEYTAKSNRRIQLLSDRHTGEQAAAVEQEIDKLVARLKDVREQIRMRSPGYAALTQPQVLSLKEVQQQLLDQDTLLLAYSLGEECSYVFAVTLDSFEVHQLPNRTEVEAAARRAYREELSINNSAAGRKATDALRRLLLGPLSARLNKKRLAIIADGALQYIPFAVLAGAEHEIVNLPSASSLAVLRKQIGERAPASKLVAILADPVFDSNDERVKHASFESDQKKVVPVRPARAKTSSADRLAGSAADISKMFQGTLHLPRLPSSRREAQSILAVAPAGESMEALDFDASRSRAIDPILTQYRIVHFATHALIDSQHPSWSGIILSMVNQQGEPQNGFLGLEDIYNLNLSADLVVLSACETGLGKELRGEGLIGLTRGFMYAGAPRLVASLWQVPDRASAELMKLFYTGMLIEKLRPAAALRQAQKKLAQDKRWSAPYYWAGFTLQGEWQ